MSLRDCFFGSVPTCAVRQAPSSSVYVLFDSDSINAVHVAKAKKKTDLPSWVAVTTLSFSHCVCVDTPFFCSNLFLPAPFCAPPSMRQKGVKRRRRRRRKLQSDYKHTMRDVLFCQMLRHGRKQPLLAFQIPRATP